MAISSAASSGEGLHETHSTSSGGSYPSLSPTSSNSHPQPRLQSHSSNSSTALPTAGSSRHPNLPPPPPPDRLPPPKGRSIKDRGGHKFKLGKKKSKAPSGAGDRVSASLEDEEWTFEGEGVTASTGAAGAGRDVPSVGTNTNGHIPIISTSRASSEAPPRDVQESFGPMMDSQLTEVPSHSNKEKDKKVSKGKGLAKKTSRLFMRDKNRDKSSDREREITSSDNHSHSSLNLPSGSRQASYSSVTSGESYSSTTSGPSRRLVASNRPMTAHPSSRLMGGSHSRRLSQESHNSWQAARSMRSGSSSTYDSPVDAHHLPIPHRQTSNLSASVPALSRHALPQPAPHSSTSPPEQTHNLPSRMSMWFSHLLPTSTNSGSTAPSEMHGGPTGPSPNPAGYASSPPRKGPSAAATFLNAARQKAVDGVRHLLDSEAQPDKCADTMWVMGVGHPGYRPTTPAESPGYGDTDPMEMIEDEMHSGGTTASSSVRPSPSKNESASLRPVGWRKDKDPATSPPQKGFTNLFSGSNISLALPSSMSPGKDGDNRTPPAESPSKGRKAKVEKELLKWPDQFLDDFRSTIWCTYRSQYAPILSMPQNLLIPTPDAYFSAFGPPVDATSPLPIPSSLGSGNAPQRPSSSPWSWSRSEERGLTSDAGWGCMLRTGQSLLANALIHLHLGRDWRVPTSKPPLDPKTSEQVLAVQRYATYVRILSWFLDDPSPLSPFSVHRMALIGKELGKEVGEWFGPSTAAGALKTLTNSFAPCGVAVATATDSIVYRSDVFTASNQSSDGWTDDSPSSSPPRSLTSRSSISWGGKAVLILIGIRLGLDGVNPIYHESVKALFTFPQSVGIAGGRPSSSYYFVASQANSLFYLDPHFTRPAVPLVIPPAPATRAQTAPTPLPKEASRSSLQGDKSMDAAYTLDVVDVDDVSIDSDSDADDTSSPSTRVKKSVKSTSSPAAKRLSAHRKDLPFNARSSVSPAGHRRTASDPFGGSSTSSSPSITRKKLPGGSRLPQSAPETATLDPETLWYASAYMESQLKTFHCEKVKKLPLSGLDPSMLLGFLVRDAEDFEDFCQRANKLPQKIFTVQDEPPSWNDSDDAGLESVSEPDPEFDADVDPDLDPDDDADPEMDDLVGGVATTRFGSDFGEDGNMSPVTVSGRQQQQQSELPRRRADVQPPLSATTIAASTSTSTTASSSEAGGWPRSPIPTTANDEDWEGGSGTETAGPVRTTPAKDGTPLANNDDERNSTLSSQPVLVEAPSDPDMRTHVSPSRREPKPPRPPFPSLTRSEMSWVQADKELDHDSDFEHEMDRQNNQSASTITPPIMGSSRLGQSTTSTRDSNDDREQDGGAGEPLRAEPQAEGKGDNGDLPQSKSRSNRDELKRSQIPSQWMNDSSSEKVEAEESNKQANTDADAEMDKGRAPGEAL